MPSKWLVAFRQIQDGSVLVDESCADSANSAVRPVSPLETPPIGTIGAIGTGRESGVEHAQPVSFDRRAEQVGGFYHAAAIVEEGAGCRVVGPRVTPRCAR